MGDKWCAKSTYNVLVKEWLHAYDLRPFIQERSKRGKHSYKSNSWEPRKMNRYTS